jgi:hypothetical protein
MMSRLQMIMLAISLVGALGAQAQTCSTYRYTPPNPDYRHSTQPWDQLPGTLAAPQTVWADPSVYGRLNLLVISPTWAARDTVELCQRIAADPTAIMTNSYTEWGEKERGYYTVPTEQLQQVAKQRLNPRYRYQAVLIGKVAWNAIPTETQQAILTQVKNGAGLVYINPDRKDATLQTLISDGQDTSLAAQVADAIPLEALAFNKDLDVSPGSPYAGLPPRHIGPLEITAARYGTGRVVFVQYADDEPVIQPWHYYALDKTALTPSVPVDNMLYDYYYAILGKVLFYAAKQDIAVTVRAKQPMVRLPRTALPAKPVTFSLTTANTEARAFIAYHEVRDQQGRVIAHGAQDVALSTTPTLLSPALPKLSRGLYMVDLWIKREGKTANWASAAVEVQDTIYLGEVHAEKEYFARTDAISGTVQLKAPLPAGLTAVVELWDSYGRLEQRVPLAAGATTFAFRPLAHPLSRTYALRAKVLEAGQVIDQSERWVGLPDNRVDDFAFMMWAGAKDTRFSQVLMHQMKQWGVTGYYDVTATWSPTPVYRRSADLLARNNLLATPYCYGAWAFRIAEQPEARSGYGKYQDTLDSYTGKIYPPKVESYRRYGVLAYSICEENYIARDVESDWTNPEAQRDFRRFLRERYGDVQKLNAVWGTVFTTFDDIAPITLLDAKTTGQYARWYAQELHKIERFNGLHEAVAGKIQQLDPGARVSLDCIEGMDFDWPRMMKSIQAGIQYPGQELRRGSEDIYGDFFGAYVNQMGENVMRATPWRNLFEGARQIGWWPSTSSGLGGASAITPELSEPTLHMRQASEEIREIQQGVGKLLMSSQLHQDPVLLLWSNASYFAGILHPTDTSWVASRHGFANLLRRIGITSRVVDSAYLEQSLEYNAQHRVLVLPCAQALSRREVEKIRAFIQQGGLVIADAVPGLFDEHLRPYGVTAGGGTMTEATCDTCKGKGRVDHGVTVATCTTCGGTGKVLTGGNMTFTNALQNVFDFSNKSVKRVGNGYTFFLHGFPGNKDEWSALRKVLAEYGKVPNMVLLTDLTGSLRLDVRGYRFNNGPGMFLGLLPDEAIADPPGGEVCIQLGRKYHGYDVRRRQYLGYGDAATVGVTPPHAGLLAFLPARIEGLSITLDKTAYKPGEVVKASGSLAPAALRDCQLVARIEVFKDRQLVECYTKNISYRQQFTRPLPLALNAERGTYTVKVTEVITGMTETRTFTVK